MRWHEIVFSGKLKYRSIRHVAFWTAWWLYFLVCYLLIKQPTNYLQYKTSFSSPGFDLAWRTLGLTLLYGMACYPLIYFILPKFRNGKWMIASISLIFTCVFLFFATDFFYWEFISSTGSPSSSRYWPAINLGLMNFAKVAVAAATIKYAKYLWLRQKERQRLEKEMINAELQLLKAQVHPDFLFKTLNNIHRHARSSSPATPGMLLKLSDLLSYMLYECDQPTVPLEKEIRMMHEYMELEKIRHNDEPEVQTNIKGDLAGKSIAPFLLVPFIENSFSYVKGMTEQFWINMDIRIEGSDFSMKLTNGIPETKGNRDFDMNRFSDVQKRLSMIYPGSHDLKMLIEEEMFIVILNISLDKVVETSNGTQDVELVSKAYRKKTTMV